MIAIPEPLAIEAMLRYGATHIATLHRTSPVRYVMRLTTVEVPGLSERRVNWILLAYVEDDDTLVLCGRDQHFNTMSNVRELPDFIRS